MRRMVGTVFCVLAVACSRDLPSAPSPAALTDDAAARPGTLLGEYVLSFVDDAHQPVAQLPVCGPSLVLQAHVKAVGAGTPAQAGTVLFEYCSFGGVPNDLTRPDEAPSSVCVSGEGRWRRLGTQGVDGSGNAYWSFGVVQIPRTVGFRFSFQQKSGDIVSGDSEPADFTWAGGSCT